MIHRDGGIGAGYGADPAANTARGIMHLRMKIATQGDLFRHGEDLLRAGFDAQLASLAVVFVNNYTRH